MSRVNIRSVTYSVDLERIGQLEYIEKIQENIELIVAKIRSEGIFIRTIRFNVLTQKNKNLLDQVYFIRQVTLLEKICQRVGVRWFNISFDLNDKTDKQIKIICSAAYEILKKFDKAFVNFLVTRKSTIGTQAALQCARTVIKVSKLTSNGYDNFRLGISANCRENTPFFPFSYASKDHNFSLAVETSQLVDSEIDISKNQDLDHLKIRLVKALGAQVSHIDRVAKQLALGGCVEYAGQDISLSPFPDEDISVLSILRQLGLKDFGANGSLFLTSYLTDILKEVISRYKLKSTGFNGVMYSLLEDKELCAANDKKTISIDSLILYSSLCGCGLDMVPVPGNILDEELASIILDVAALASRLNKPLGIRVLPIPHGFVNEYTQFDMDFLTNTRILQVKNLSVGDSVFNMPKMSYLNKTANFNKESESIELNEEGIKDFWDKRANKFIADKSLSATNLESDSELMKLKVELEKEKIESVLNINSADVCLDLGCGLGYWSEFFSGKSKKVTGVDYSEQMVGIARDNAFNKEIKNVEYFCSDASEFISEDIFSFIFVSGLLLYLTDEKLHTLTALIDSYSTTGTSLMLREPTGLHGRHVIADEFSETLQADYSAVYRTRDELISTFEAIGFQWQLDDDMFPDKSPLNKWGESRLRLYSFIKS